MTTKEIIETILEQQNLTPNALAKTIGVTAPQIYDLQKGRTKKISAGIANKVITSFPQYSFQWLTTGEGSMLSTQEPSPVNIAIDNSVAGNNNTTESSELVSLLRKRLKELEDREKALQDLLTKKEAQIEKLINIMSKE